MSEVCGIVSSIMKREETRNGEDQEGKKKRDEVGMQTSKR